MPAAFLQHNNTLLILKKGNLVVCLYQEQRCNKTDAGKSFKLIIMLMIPPPPPTLMVPPYQIHQALTLTVILTPMVPTYQIHQALTLMVPPYQIHQELTL